MADISLVIINDNAEEYCYALFKSIKEQINPDELNIVFIDNCSKDDSVKKAREFGIRKIYTFNTWQEYRGVLYNKGFSLSEGNNIIFVHSDVIFGEKFFDKLVYKINNQQVGQFTSFCEFTPNMDFWGNNTVGIDNTNEAVFVRELFKELPKDVDWLLECSAPCFMVNRSFLDKITINVKLKNSFIEHNILLDILRNDGRHVISNDCCYIHHSIELHDKIKTFDNDHRSFVISLIKYYKFSNDKLHEYLQFSQDQINGLKQQINGLNRQIDGLDQQIEDLALQLKEMPIALFFLKVRSKIKNTIKNKLK